MEKENTAQPGIYSENTLVFIICGVQNKRAATSAAILAAKYKYGLGLKMKERGTSAKGTRVRHESIESLISTRRF